MTELVVGKKLQVPRPKDFSNLAAYVAHGQYHSKTKATLQDAFNGSIANPEHNIHDKTLYDPEISMSAVHEVSSELIATEYASQNEALANVCETNSLTLLPAQEVESADEQNQSHLPSNDTKMNQFDSPPIHGDSQQIQDNAANNKSVAVADDSVEELKDDDAPAELDTDTTLGFSVAILMGKSVPKHKNIFDLMDSTASSWIKRSLGKQSQSSIELEKKKNESLRLAAQQQEIDAALTTERLSQENNSHHLPLIETLQPIQLDAGAFEIAEIGDHTESIIFPPIGPEKAFHSNKHERRGAKSPPILHNRAINETMKLRFGNLRMGEGRFSFDDVAVKTKEQLIRNLRQKGDKTDLRELQKESQSKLREILKERLNHESQVIKCKSDGNQTLFRVEHMLSKRVPEPQNPSPETIKKWHAAAKKAGVPSEALTKSQTNLAIEYADDEIYFVNGPATSEAKPHIPRSSVNKAKPAATLIPRIVNPDHMEMLLSQSSPKVYTQHAISVSVQMPTRLDRNDILWKMLCAFD